MFVLDLRNNPGGLLTQAVSVSDAFLEQGEIVSTRGRAEGEGERYNAQAGDLIEGKPNGGCLSNGGSASAVPRIVAGACKNHRRAIIVGTRTVSAMDLVQTVMAALRWSDGFGRDPPDHLGYYNYTRRDGPFRRWAVAGNSCGNNRRGAPIEEAKPGRRTAGSKPICADAWTMAITCPRKEQRQMEEERARVEEVAQLREEDYQLAYALDILRGLTALNGR